MRMAGTFETHFRSLKHTHSHTSKSKKTAFKAKKNVNKKKSTKETFFIKSEIIHN